MTPEQLRAQAEKRAAAATPSGILRTPPTNTQLIRGATEELENQEMIKNAEAFAQQKKTEEEATMARLGLTAPAQTAQVTPVSNIAQTPITEDQLVTRQPKTPTGLEGAINVPQAPAQEESMILSAVKDLGAGSQQAMLATDKLMTDFEKKSADLEAKKAQAEKDYIAKRDEIDNQIKNFPWDNRSVWEKSTTPQKVFLAITGFLSSMSQSGAKAFQDSIEKTMQADMDQQKARYEQLKATGKENESFYGQLVQKFGSEQAADLQMMNAKLGMVQNKLNAIKDSANSKIVAANALKGLEIVDQTKFKNNLEAQKLAAQLSANTIEGFRGKKLDDKQYSAAVEVKNARDKSLQAIDNLNANLAAGKIPLTQAKSDYAKNRDVLVFDLAKVLSGGKPSDVELEKAEKLVPSQYSPSAAKDLEALKKKIDQDFNIFMRNIGQTRVGSEIGRVK